MKTLLVALAMAVVVAAHGWRTGWSAGAPGIAEPGCGHVCDPSEGVVARADDPWATDTTLMMDVIGAAGECPLCGAEREVQALEASVTAAAGIGGYRPPVLAQVFDPAR